MADGTVPLNGGRLGAPGNICPWLLRAFPSAVLFTRAKWLLTRANTLSLPAKEVERRSRTGDRRLQAATSARPFIGPQSPRHAFGADLVAFPPDRPRDGRQRRSLSQLTPDLFVDHVPAPSAKAWCDLPSSRLARKDKTAGTTSRKLALSATNDVGVPKQRRSHVYALHVCTNARLSWRFGVDMKRVALGKAANRP